MSKRRTDDQEDLFKKLIPDDGWKKVKLSKIIFLAAILALFLGITNPAMVPFLPQSMKDSLGNVWGSLFGDVNSTMKVLTINWGAVFNLIAMLLILFLVNAIGHFIMQQIHPTNGKGKSIQTLCRSAFSWLLGIIGIFWGLSFFGVSMGAVMASIGVMALIVGFGAESLVADVVTGIFLVFENQFNVDDIIELDSFRGTVDSIGIRTTCIRDAGGNIKIVNNSDIRNVLNRSAVTSMTTTTVGVSYGTDIELLEAVLSRILPNIRDKYPDIFVSNPVYLGIQELGSSSMNLKIMAEVQEKDVFVAPRLMNREIKIGFDKAGIEIPFPQVVVHQDDQSGSTR